MFLSTNLTFIGKEKQWKSAPLPLLVPCVFHSDEREEREHSSREEMMLQRKLEVELRHIQQQMQYYFSRKQELKYAAKPLYLSSLASCCQLDMTLFYRSTLKLTSLFTAEL